MSVAFFGRYKKDSIMPQRHNKFLESEKVELLAIAHFISKPFGIFLHIFA